MDPESLERLGKIVGIILLAIPALIFLKKALASEETSAKYANWSLFLGLLVLARPLQLFQVKASTHPEIVKVAGGIRILIALVGLVFAYMALKKKSDGGVGSGRPFFGIIANVFHAVFGASALMFVSFASGVSDESERWVYDSPDGAFSVTLPSESWKPLKKQANFHTVFAHNNIPRMLAMVVAVENNRDRTAYEDKIRKFEGMIANHFGKRDMQLRTGEPSSDRQYHYRTFMQDTEDGKEVYVAYAIHFNKETGKLIVIMFEGQLKMMSEMGRETELDTMKKSAEIICQSLE